MDGEIVTPKPERFLRIGSVLDRTGLSRTTLYRKIAEGSFPKQIRISERCTAWREADVDRWVHEALVRSVEQQEVLTQPSAFRQSL